MIRLLCIALVLFAASARAQGQARSGAYGPDKSGINVYVLIAGEDAVLSYAWGGKRASCYCEPHAHRQGDGSYKIVEEEMGARGSFTANAKGLRFASSGDWSCCYHATAPQGLIPFASGPTQCSIKAERAFFYEVPTKLLERHPYVQRGDVVQIIPTPDGPDSGETGYVIGLFQGPKRATLGLLKSSELDCGPSK